MSLIPLPLLPVLHGVLSTFPNCNHVHIVYQTCVYQDKRRRYSMMRSNESTSSVFYHSLEEEAGKSGSDGPASESGPGLVEHDDMGNN